MEITAGIRAGYEPQPMFSPLARLPYALAAFVVVVTIVLFELTGFSLSPDLTHTLVVPWLSPWLLLVYFVIGPLARRIGWPRLGGAFECLGFLYGQAIFVFTLLPLTALSGPLTDARLASWDRAIGFDWVAFVTRAEPFVPLLHAAYYSFEVQALCLILALFFVGHERRAWKLTSAALIAVIVCSAIYPFFPANSAMMHHGVYPTPDNQMVVVGPLIQEVKNGARVVSWPMLKGLITFPSYHAAAALLFAWAAWPIRVLRWPIIALNFVMTIACIVVGSHYFVDVLGGYAVAILSFGIATYWYRPLNVRLRPRGSVPEAVGDSPALSSGTTGNSNILVR